MSDSLSDLRPGPRTVVLAGKPYKVHEARLIDLADLQGWVDDQHPPTLAETDPEAAAEGLTGAELDRVLFKALLDIEEGRPELGTPEAQLALMSPAGIATFVTVALRRGQPGLTDADVAEVVGAMSYDELKAVRTAFYRPNVAPRIVKLLDIPEKFKGRGDPIGWPEAVDEVARERGWTYDYVLSLSLSEFRTARRNGKPVEHALYVPKEMIDAVNERRCQALYGMSAAEHFYATYPWMKPPPTPPSVDHPAENDTGVDDAEGEHNAR